MNENNENNDKINPPSEQWETLTNHDVAKLFNEFVSGYDYWRSLNGLTGSIDNIHEALTAMSDKHGRLCRQIKHFERNDPKPDWPEGMTESIVGYLIYALMVLKKYDVDILKGMKNELQNAADQHATEPKAAICAQEMEADSSSDAPVIKFVSLLILDAVKLGTHKITLYGDDDFSAMFEQENGFMIKQDKIPNSLRGAVISRIGIMAGIKLCDWKNSENYEGKIEVNILGTEYSIDVKTTAKPIPKGKSFPTIEMTINKECK